LARVSVLCLVAVGLAGCHEDPQVVRIIPGTTAVGLTLTSCGGAATATGASVVGTGGNGGAGHRLTPPTNKPGPPFSVFSHPTPPTAPTTGTPLSSITSDITQTSGNILISGSVTTDAVAARSITASAGDIVVSGTLQSADNGAGQTNLSLSAPNGTV